MIGAASLMGRGALITGASRGIGAAIARALAAAGARAVVTARSAGPLAALAAEIGAVPVVADLTRGDDVTRLADATRGALGGAPDILVNNAGVFLIAPLAAMPEATFVDTIDTNVVAPFRLVRAFLPELRARGGGHVVSIGSIADRMVFPENGAYSPAKFALRALHEVLRSELRGTGVRATLVSPGAVDTALWDRVLAAGNAHERALPTREAMLPADAVADAVLYAVTCPAAVNIDELRLSRA